MLLLALCAGAAVEYSGRCVAAPAPPLGARCQGTRPINLEVGTASGRSALVRGSISKPDNSRYLTHSASIWRASSSVVRV
jgi:hypothetical protein